MQVCVLVLDGVFDTGLSAILDTLQTANELSESSRGAPFRVTVSGLRRRAKTQQGWQVALATLPHTRPDIVIVPALGAKTPITLASALLRKDVAETASVLNAWSRAGTPVAAACTGTFVLAHAGVLDGRRATTTWWLAPYFRERFPLVELEESRMVVDSGGVITAGAALAHIDLALWLVRRRSPALARKAAHFLTFDGRPSQAAYVMQDHLTHTDPLVEKFESWARRHLSAFSLDAAARSVGTSERTLERRVRAVLGKSPLSFVQDLRVEQAIHRLHTTAQSIEEIADAVGYRDGVTLRTLLRKKTGRGIRELRLAANPGADSGGFRGNSAGRARRLTARAAGGKVAQ
ncbi:MAG TPA: helix-turn-helix domain-containing protein [Polyangiaceae bacterium]|jgi:transcriptional regulator GlxA family with amidase domain